MGSEHRITDNDLFHDAILAQTITSTSAVKGNTNNTAGGWDCTGYARLCALIHIGAFGGTTTSITVKLQLSKDDVDGDYGDISGATTGAVTSAPTGPLMIEYNLEHAGHQTDSATDKTFVRAVATAAGSSPSVPIAVGFILYRSYHTPPTQENAVVAA